MSVLLAGAELFVDLDKFIPLIAIFLKIVPILFYQLDTNTIFVLFSYRLTYIPA